jgi:outer membrane lipoprotein-sorting protein
VERQNAAQPGPVEAAKELARMHKPVVLAVVACWACTLGWGGVAVAEDKLDGKQVLAKVDHAINAFKDAVWESRLRVKEPNGQWRELTFTTYQKVPGKRLVRFTGGESKGMNVLVESTETIYVYLPEFKRVRRMGTHVKNQTFGGSDFSSEDMSQTAYGTSFDPKLLSEDDKSWVLELAAKPGPEREFPRCKMWVSKEHFQPIRIEWMDASGKKLKTEERADFKKDSPEHWQPMRITLVDHRRNDHTSEIIFLTSKIDSGLGDDMFTVRALQR